MVFRNVGLGFSFDDNSVPIGGDDGEPMLQSDKKLVTRAGATKQVADIDVQKDLVDEGDYSSGVLDIGGTSGIAIALESNDSNSFEVLIDLLDDGDNVRTTIDSADFAGLQGTVVNEVIPVFSDTIEIRVVDRSGGAENNVTGSINANIGTPTNISTTVSSGQVQIKGDDNDFFEDQELNQSPAASDISMLTYAARALNSQDLDEFITRVTNSQGTQIDPLTTDVTASLSNDELRSRILGVNDAGNLAEAQVEALDTAVASTTVAQIDYIARALNSQSLDEFVSRVTDSNGTQIDPLTQDPLQSVANDELRSRLFGLDAGGVLQQVNAEQFDTALGTTDVGLATYLARALSSLAQDEVRVASPNPLDVSAAEVDVDITSQTLAEITTTLNAALASVANDEVRVNLQTNNAGTLPVEQQTPVGVENSAGTQIDPLTTAILQSVANDEARTRLFAPDSGGTLQQATIEALNTAIAAGDFGLVTYLARALNSIGNDSVQTTGASRDEFEAHANDAELNSGAGGGTKTHQFSVTENMDKVRVAVDDAEGSFHVEVAFQDGAGTDLVVRDNNNSSDFSGDGTTDVFVSVEIAAPQVEVRIVDDSGASNTVDYNIRAN